MNRTSSIVRASVALGLFAFLAGSFACSSAPDGAGAETLAASDDALSFPAVCAPGYTHTCTDETVGGKLVCSPCVATYVKDEASPPDTAAGDVACAVLGTLPVPPELARKGCTFGTTYYGSYDSANPSAPINIGGSIWACPAGVAAPPSLSGVTIPAGFAASAPFATSVLYSRCLGAPALGWEFVTETVSGECADAGNDDCNQNCHGVCMPQLGIGH